MNAIAVSEREQVIDDIVQRMAKRCHTREALNRYLTMIDDQVRATEDEDLREMYVEVEERLFLKCARAKFRCEN